MNLNIKDLVNLGTRVVFKYPSSKSGVLKERVVDPFVYGKKGETTGIYGAELNSSKSQHKLFDETKIVEIRSAKSEDEFSFAKEKPTKPADKTKWKQIYSEAPR